MTRVHSPLTPAGVRAGVVRSPWPLMFTETRASVTELSLQSFRYRDQSFCACAVQRYIPASRSVGCLQMSPFRRKLFSDRDLSQERHTLLCVRARARMCVMGRARVHAWGASVSSVRRACMRACWRGGIVGVFWLAIHVRPLNASATHLGTRVKALEIVAVAPGGCPGALPTP